MSTDTTSTSTVPQKRRSIIRRIPPGMLRRETAAEFCGLGASTWDRLSAAGLTPMPIKLCGSLCWGRRELSAWIDHGCPSREEWSHIWQALLRGQRTARSK
jgi:predicted DNA-binding transcriptional regulator AlpA